MNSPLTCDYKLYHLNDNKLKQILLESVLEIDQAMNKNDSIVYRLCEHVPPEIYNERVDSDIHSWSSVQEFVCTFLIEYILHNYYYKCITHVSDAYDWYNVTVEIYPKDYKRMQEIKELLVKVEE